ncbi:MAG TPA: 16S rRNA (cytidine(1402)-2'-O)-methyltransferase [bacterium]|nr:16S rRNA (cytidine(1402)-2'-O)-methyltransferase [bacterium]
MSKTKLWIVATPIGNKDDITLRALEILKSADIIIGEDYRYTDKLLKTYGIFNKRIEELNEHNESEKSDDLINLLKSGTTIALISEHGMPIIADPGAILITKCYENKIDIDIAAGISSITTALAVSGFKVDDFCFFSKIPRNKEERKKFFIDLRKNKQIKVLIDAPYRLLNLLENIYYNYSNKAELAVCLELTTDRQKILRGAVKEILEKFKKENFKGEYILIVK